MARLPYHRTIIVVCFALAALCLSCIDCAAQEAPQPITKALVALVVGTSLDAVSTEIALQRPGLAEGNAIMGQSPSRRIAVKAAGAGVQVYLLRKIGQRHPKIAKGISYGTAGLYTVVAFNNLRLARTK